jgi:hypothetical protein
MPTATPEVIEVPVEVIRTVEVPIVQTVEVVKTVEVMVTPVPTEIAALPAPTQIETEVKEEPNNWCIDSAKIELQPVSDIQASAKKIGTRRKLVWFIQNTGDCYWDGYKWESTEDYLSLDVPYTVPGGLAVIEYEFPIQGNLSLRMFLVPPSPSGIYGLNASGMLGLSNVNTVDDGAVYYLEAYDPKIIGAGPSYRGGCPPGG